MSFNQQKKLIDACNLICEHIGAHLPDGWQIVLAIDRDEASLSLVDPDGEDVDYFGDSYNSSIQDAIDHAIESSRQA